MSLGVCIAILAALSVANAVVIAVLFLSKMLEEITARTPGRTPLPGDTYSSRNVLRALREYRSVVPDGRLHVHALVFFAIGIVGSLVFVLLLSMARFG